MARVVVEFFGGPSCGGTDTVETGRRLPRSIGLYEATGRRVGKGRHAYAYRPPQPAAPRGACLRHVPTRPGCPGHKPAEPP